MARHGAAPGSPPPWPVAYCGPCWRMAASRPHPHAVVSRHWPLALAPPPLLCTRAHRRGSAVTASEGCLLGKRLATSLPAIPSLSGWQRKPCLDLPLFDRTRSIDEKSRQNWMRSYNSHDHCGKQQSRHPLRGNRIPCGPHACDAVVSRTLIHVSMHVLQRQSSSLHVPISSPWHHVTRDRCRL